MPIYSDLVELKRILEIPDGDKSEDVKIALLLDMASSWIEEVINRPGIFYKQRTEIYNGTNTQKLLLKSRPVYAVPTIQVFADESAYFGSAPGSFDPTSSALVYGTDFCLKLDGDDGLTSRSGILIRLKDYWQRPCVRQRDLLTPFVGEAFGNIKVIYFGGYSVDNLPSAFRFACNLLVGRMRYIMPLSYETSSENYEDRSVSTVISAKEGLMGLVRPILANYRNWTW